MKTIGLLIKPASSSCNMVCQYCFYRDEAQRRKQASYGIMSIQTVDILLKKLFSADYQKADIMFQGGEPTLAGLDFFEKFTESVQKYNQRGVSVSYAIQTNGLCITEEWAAFFAKHRFLVGVSLDGPRVIHDLNRKDIKGQDTHQKIMRSVEKLKKHDVAFNILSVVTKRFAKHIDSIWQFYKSNGFEYLQFIPCLDPMEKERGKETYSLSPAEYGEFLKKSFDYWYRDTIQQKHTYVRYFDELLFLVTGAGCPSCTLSGKCCNQMVIEADGSVYPCDFYVLDQYRIGSIYDNDLDELWKKGTLSPFVSESEMFKVACKGCRWYRWCRGGCRRDWTDGKNYFCSSYQTFFAYAEQRLRFLGRQIRPY